MQEDSGNHRSTQPGRPVRQLQIRRHIFRISRHSLRHGVLQCAPGRDACASRLHVIDDPRRFPAKPVGALMPGGCE